MGEAWIALAGVVIGGVIVGVSSWLAGRDRFRKETDWDRRQLLREKLEEIGGLADQVNSGFRELCTKFMQAITLDEPLHLESEIPFARLTLLVAFYAPELQPKLDAVVEARDLLGANEADAVLGDADRAARGQAVVKLWAAWGAMQQACQALADGAAASGRERYGLAGDFD